MFTGVVAQIPATDSCIRQTLCLGVLSFPVFIAFKMFEPDSIKPQDQPCPQQL